MAFATDSVVWIGGRCWKGGWGCITSFGGCSRHWPASRWRASSFIGGIGRETATDRRLPFAGPRGIAACVAGSPLPESDAADVPGPDRTARVVGPGLPRPANVRLAHPGRDGQFTDKVRDEGSLREYREAISHRAERAKAQLREQLERLRLDRRRRWIRRCRPSGSTGSSRSSPSTRGTTTRRRPGSRRRWSCPATPGVPTSVRAHMTALLGINALRRGEQDNCIGCVGPSSCIFPIGREAVHTRPSGSREAVRWFSTYLDEWPGDLRIRWLLNIAAMTLGEYPDKVPPRFRIPVAPFRSKLDLGRFENVALRVGLIGRGPDLAGGCIFDDFTGDGRPDVFTTSFDVVHGASLYVNRGDGRFEDRSAAAGLDDQVYALNVTRADYDNDGRLDVAAPRAPGRSRPGCRSCGTRGTASSRT